MTPRSFTTSARRFALLACAPALLLATSAHALRVVNYNILNYPGSTGSARAQYYRTILQPLAADVIVAGEITSGTGPTQFLNEVLEVMEPGQWATVPFIDGNDTDNTLFYRISTVQFLGQWAFYPNLANQLRYIHVYRIQPVGYTSSATEIRFYAGHLKASTGFESQRLAECTGLRDSMNAMPTGTHAFVIGDLNFYKQSSEPGYAKLLESQADNDGRVYDVLTAGEWHDTAAFANIHTQSPCLSGTCASGASTGGMDDRFDFILPTYNFGTGQGLAVVGDTCVAVGNDGQHLNKNITDAPTIPEGATYATALQLASDHIPVRIDLQMPAKLTTSPSLALGTVIVGAPSPSQMLSVSNPATPPADALDCTLVAPAGFSTTSPLSVAAGASADATVSLATGTAGSFGGDLTITSDAPDTPTALVALSGTVLDHAAASLDSESVVLAGAVDFGEHEAGGFTQQSVRVFNTGYDALQARLLVGGVAIDGGDARFSVVQDPTGALLASTGEDCVIAFDDAGATLDSTYTATLTVSSGDEALPGAIAQPDLTVSLQARVMSSVTGVTQPAVITSTRLFGAAPNPFRGATSIRLDVAQTVSGAVVVYDLAGRRVATLRDGVLPSGRHVISWNGQTDAGARIGSGVYVVRLTSATLATQSLRIAVVR